MKCLCGGVAQVEHILDFKAAFTGGDPLKTRFRVTCTRCGEGSANIRGFSTKDAAVRDWEKSMQMIVDLASEYNVTPKQFLETINKDFLGRG